MVYALSIYKAVLKMVYFFLKMLPVKKHQVVLLSRQSNEPSMDFQYVMKEIQHQVPDAKIIALTKRMEKNNPIQILGYVFHPFEQMYYLATSEVCIIDGYQIPVSCLTHKPELKIVQLWHSLAAIKKFGCQTLFTEKDRKVAQVMRMHQNYDLVVSGSDAMIEPFSEAFQTPKEKFISVGTPRTDYLIDTKEENQKKVYSLYPDLKGKKIALYVPTFRTYDEYRIQELIDAFQSSAYQLIVKVHPRTKIQLPDSIVYPQVTSLEMMSVADVVITDYSAISCEAAILDKPVVLFVYDEERYSAKEGMNIDLREALPGYVFTNELDLVKALEKEYDERVLKHFKEKYVSGADGHATERLVKMIMEEKK